MNHTILTVDDSKAVRIIVKRCFKNFDAEITEAQNGVEGLAAASKNVPDLILLDVTMPVMDGVEMLTKLKSDPNLKGIPVIMLTAEAGKEMVMKIAKIGVRDYIVKPFKEDVLLEKVSRIIDLRPLGEGAKKQKKLSDAVNMLVVEDKPAIIQQISEGISYKSWKVNGVSTSGEAIDSVQKAIPDVILISLSLADDEAFNLFRLLRSNNKTKYVPIFGLAVKTAAAEQQKAQQVGFTSLITKPIDFSDLESKVVKSINLDTSERYFEFGKDVLVIKLPEGMNNSMINELNAFLKPKVSEAVDNGIGKIVFDVHDLKTMDINLIKLLFDAMQTCKELTLKYSLQGNSKIAAECQNFEESKDWTFHETLDEAKASLA